MNSNKKEWIKFPKEDAENVCQGFQTMLDVLKIKDTDKSLPIGSGLSFERLADAVGFSGKEMRKPYILTKNIFKNPWFLAFLIGGSGAVVGFGIIKCLKNKKNKTK